MEGGQGEFDRPERPAPERPAREREREGARTPAGRTEAEPPRRRSLATPTVPAAAPPGKPEARRSGAPATPPAQPAQPRRNPITVQRRQPEPPKKVPVAPKGRAPAAEPPPSDVARPRRMRPDEARPVPSASAEPASRDDRFSRRREMRQTVRARRALPAEEPAREAPQAARPAAAQSPTARPPAPPQTPRHAALPPEPRQAEAPARPASLDRRPRPEPQNPEPQRPETQRAQPQRPGSAARQAEPPTRRPADTERAPPAERPERARPEPDEPRQSARTHAPDEPPFDETYEDAPYDDGARPERVGPAPPPPRGVIIDEGGDGVLGEGPIVAPDTIAGRGLTIVVAIMTFLSALLLGAAILIDRAADAWSVGVMDEVSVTVLPLDGEEIDGRLLRVAAVLGGTEGLTDVSILPLDQSEALLEPWLGDGVDLSLLPVPRLVTAARSGPFDADALAAELEDIQGVSVDDHSAWSERLSAMASGAAAGSIGALALMLVATAISIVFATRSTLATNSATVEVLHVLGAEDRFIARAFRRRFLRIGLRGALAGLLAAYLLFGALDLGGLVFGRSASPQAEALFGNPSIGLAGYLALALVAAGVAILVTVTSNWSVRRHLNHLSH
ncbi:cell division protein FtsX [Acuticoccus kandeliae]|uniref:cell division protein FtsX n=1 Tax=Acuticoccus kandeliae TaxID=2073160 RepID=UPI000D3E6D19|nr:FtsX-like permease family protein [Acuticoccus kandeliae]